MQASEAQIIKDMQVQHRSIISLFHHHNMPLHVVAAVISAANELNRVRVATCSKHHPDVNRQQLPPLLNFGQASQIDPSHPVPPMLLALHTRVLQDDRWLVRPSPTVFVISPPAQPVAGGATTQGAAANDGTVFAIAPTFDSALLQSAARVLRAPGILTFWPVAPRSQTRWLALAAVGSGKHVQAAAATFSLQQTGHVRPQLCSCCPFQSFHPPNFFKFEIHCRLVVQVNCGAAGRAHSRIASACVFELNKKCRSFVVSLVPSKHQSLLEQPFQQTLLHIVPKVFRPHDTECCRVT
jgi:hypothetical protein